MKIDAIHAEVVPPPEEAREQDLAKSLGLLRGLEVEEYGSQYRCSNCEKLQPGGSLMVWVPDGVRPDDPAWSVTEMARAVTFNGSGSGWCLSCAMSLGKPKPWWRFW